MDTKSRELSGQDAEVATPLQRKIMDTIAEDIPLNLICHRCEYEMPFEGVIDTDSSKDEWINTVIGLQIKFLLR